MYAEVVKATNPESKAFVAWKEIECIDRHLLFTSIFISFTGQWKGFLRGCRPLIGVDGTHLKGNYGGILLTAVGLDGNNEIFPIAYAIVGQEDKESWSFFFWHLVNIVKDSSRKDWTIISDRQKGVDLALTELWPEADRRYFCRHLSRNYKKAFPGPLMYILFWRACNATSFFTFRKAMERLKKEGGDEVLKWFTDLGDQSRWSKHKFNPNVCNDSNTSNFVESFNSTLGIDRCRPVLTLLKGIRRVCMARLATRHENSMSWKNDEICPKIAKMVKAIGKASFTCKAYKSKPGEYEIHEGKSQFPMSLNQKICSCGACQLSGIPCRHAIRALVDAKLDPREYVSSWYSVKTYRHIYSVGINPVPDQEQWPLSEDGKTVLPPKMKRGIGRPSRNRKREEGEEQPGKRSKTVKCSKCGCFGHNSRTCKVGLTGKELKASEPVVLINPRVRDQSNASKSAKEGTKSKGECPNKNSGNTSATQTILTASQLHSQSLCLSQSQSQS